MKKTRFKSIAVVVLVLTALVGLVLAAPGRGGYRQRGGYEFGAEGPGRFGMGMERPGGPAGLGGPGILRILSRLELTDEQQESVKKITEEAKEKDKAVAEAVVEARKALREAVDKGEESAIRKAATDIGKVLGDQAVLKVQTMASIKKVLTPEQLQKLEELKAKMKERAEEALDERDVPRFHQRSREFGRQRGYSDERYGFGRRGRGYDEGYGRRGGRFEDDRRDDWGW